MIAVLLLLLAAPSSSSTVAIAKAPEECGETIGRCPIGLDGRTTAELLGCGFWKDSIQWKCRATSAVGEIEAETKRANDLGDKLIAAGKDIDKLKGSRSTGVSPIAAIGSVGCAIGGAGFASLFEVESTRDRALIVAGSSLVGAGTCALAFFFLSD